MRLLHILALSFDPGSCIIARLREEIPIDQLKGTVGPLALTMRLGAFVVTAVFVTLLLGLWIDRRLGVSPCGLLLFTIVGVAVSTLGVYRTVQDSYNKDAPPKEGQ